MTARPTPLEAVRSRIDEIDADLLRLLDERAAMPAKVAAAKALEAQEGGQGFALRPAREAQLLRKLLAMPHPAASSALIVRIWRELIGDSLTKQGPFRLAAWGGRYPERIVDLARFRFGSAAPITLTEKPEEALLAARTEGTVAILSLEPAATWWARLLAEPTLNVFDALPCFGQGEAPGALAVAKITVEPSGGDQTFWVTDARLSPASLTEAISALGLAGEVVFETGGLQLVALAGYVQAEDQRLERAPGRLRGVIGSAPLPFEP